MHQKSVPGSEKKSLDANAVCCISLDVAEKRIFFCNSALYCAKARKKEVQTFSLSFFLALPLMSDHDWKQLFLEGGSHSRY